MPNRLGPGNRGLPTHKENPMTDSGQNQCACGCGTPVPAGRNFAQGHDQRAIYARVHQIGTTVEFLAWFDALPAATKKTQD